MTPPNRSALPWWRDRLLVSAFVILGAWGLLALTWPLSGDAGVFAWMADTLHRGAAPYVNAWDTKGPAAWLPSLLVQVVFGRTAWGIRLFDVAMVVVALASLRSIARRLEQPGDGRVAMALYALWYASLDYWQSAQPDGWVAAWLVLGCAVALTGTWAGSLVAGLLVGLCTMVKPFYLGYAVVMWMLVSTIPQRTVRERAAHGAVVTLGIAAAIGLQLLLLASRGALPAYLAVQQWNRDVYAGLGGPWLTRIPAVVKGILQLPWGVVAPVALFGALRSTRTHRLAIAALTVGFLGAVAGVMLQGKGWQYHWLPMLPFFALLADVGYAALRQETAGEVAGRFRWLALLLALAMAGITPLQQCYRWARARGSAERVATYERREFDYYGRHPGSVYAILDSLQASAGGAAPVSVLVWAMHPAPQVLAGLTIPTRFAVIRPLFDGAQSTYRAAYRSEFLRELRAAPPRWWLLPAPSLLARVEELRDHDIARFPEAAAELNARYRVAGQSAEWVIHEMIAPAAVR